MADDLITMPWSGEQATLTHRAEERGAAHLSALEHDFEAVALGTRRPRPAQRRARGKTRRHAERSDLERARHFAGTVAAGHDHAPQRRAVEQAPHDLRQA